MKYTIDNEIYDVKIIRKNNKNSYIRVKSDSIIYVTTNYLTTKNQIKKFLDSNIKFLKSALEKQNKKLEKEKYIYYLGKKYDLIISNIFSNVEIEKDKIYTQSSQELKKYFDTEFKTLATSRYKNIYDFFDENIPYYNLKFRLMKTRWGVCNRKSKTITLNTKLIEYDIKCLDYVIVHELSHLIEFNHSKAFWHVVEKYCPQYKDIRKILKD